MRCATIVSKRVLKRAVVLFPSGSTRYTIRRFISPSIRPIAPSTCVPNLALALPNIRVLCVFPSNHNISHERFALFQPKAVHNECVPAVSSPAPPKGLLYQLTRCLDTYLVEPLLTLRRLIHIVILFAPVMLAVPLLILGPRVREEENERCGALWWFDLLAAQMERAGPTFIKVTWQLCIAGSNDMMVNDCK